MKRRLEEIQVFGFPELGAGMVIPSQGPTLYVDSVRGKDGRDGFDHRHPIENLQRAFDRATQIGEAGITIQVAGVLAAQLVAPDLPDLTIQGINKPLWTGPAAPVAVTPLLEARAAGLTLAGFRMVPPADHYGVMLSNDAAAGWDATRFKAIGNLFQFGFGGIADDGGHVEVELIGNHFNGMAQAGIELLALDVGTPRRWLVEGNRFFNSAEHILCSMQHCLIKDNYFGTVDAAGLYIDLDMLVGTQGFNIVAGNILGGVYAAADYNANASDIWAGNFTVAGITAANPV